MTKNFIDQVRSIVLNNISDEKFGVQELASLLNLSTSHTLRKVKTATGKSVNQYIRELRLEKAAKLIKKTDLSIAEISYQVGFSSASYFNKAFRKYYGIAPGEYKTKSISLSELTANKPERKPPKVSLKKKIFFPVVIALVLVIGYLLIINSATKNSSFENSIAVLPFKDFSPEDSQWFSDGVSDNILHSLAQMKDLSVISFTSSSTFRDSDKTIPEIAKELGVSYILEGSVTLVEDKIKIIAQLIDSNDEHIWSKEYNESFDDIIAVQNNVAQEVMEQLKITLSPQETVTLEKYPTDNMEAYNLHLKGRLINGSRSKDDLLKNMELNKKAIALDSNFAEAYAQVAASNLINAINNVDFQLSSNHKYIKEAIYYVDKALELDPQSAKANAVKARIYLGNDWDQCKEYFEKAIALNPNDAETNYWYADYFLKIDKADIKQALQHATIANQLNPFSSVIATKYTWLLILNEKYEEADQYIKEYGFLMSHANRSWLSAFSIGFKNKGWQPAFDWLENLLIEEPKDAGDNYKYLSELYHEIHIDKLKDIEYGKKAFELNADHFWYYFKNLTENGYFKEAEQVMQTDFFKNLSEYRRTNYTWQYYYYKEDYKQAQNLIDEKPELFRYRALLKTYAQLGDRVKLDSINKIYFVHGEYKYFSKVYVHAILKDRDSMYYYLNKLRYSFRNAFPVTNGSPEFDPYKNDTRYKALLKEFYIPVPGE